MNSTLSLKTTRFAFGFALLTGLVLSATPLLGTLGPESALVLGVLLPPWAAAVGARAMSVPKRSRETGVVLVEAFGASALLTFIPMVILALNALRVRTCDPWSGITFMVLGPLAGCLLAASVGAFLKAIVTSPTRATWLSVLVPIAAILSALHAFVNTPAIFSYGHFFGYFPGTFYDRRIDVPHALWTLKALDLAILVVLAGITLCLRGPGKERFLEKLARHPAASAVVILASIGIAFVQLDANSYGHATSAAFIAETLGHGIDSARCRVFVPREMDHKDAELLAEDCDFRVGQIEQRLGVRETERITAFFFRSQNEKRVLMGAARVYIAKPWRREVYLNLAEFPHPVLAHELAHVVARHATSGPFGVPGHLGGLIPEPTLVEGLAVALEPTARDELTPHQWTKAARQSGMAVSLESLLGPSFLGKNAALAYTLAGSFLSYVFETYGAATVRKIYETNDVVSVLKKPWSELEKGWLFAVDRVPLPPRVEALAKVRFGSPSVFSAVCPHEVERLSQELSGALSAADISRAQETCKELLEIDPRDTATRAVLVSTLALAGKSSEARAELEKLEKLPAPAPTIARARVGLADASYINGDFETARTIYQALLDVPQNDADLRQIEVKALGVDASEPSRSALSELLIGKGGDKGDARVAMHAIGVLQRARKDGLGDYLEARQLHGAHRHDLAHPLFVEALTRGLPTRRLRLEAMRLRGSSAYALGAMDDVVASFSALAAEPDLSEADRLEAADWQARAAFRKKRERH